MTTPRGPSSWVKKYMEGYEDKRVSIEQILDAENVIRRRCGTRLLKYLTVKRSLNLAGLSVRRDKTKNSQAKVAEMEASVADLKPCMTCRYYVRDACKYPADLFEYYPSIDEFYQDISRKQCKLKELKET